MTLTPVQRRTLRQYVALRFDDPGLGPYLRQSLRHYLLLALVFAIGGGAILLVSRVTFFWLLCGLIGGAVLRDIGHYRRFVQFWPVLRQTLDWERVAALLEEWPDDLF